MRIGTIIHIALRAISMYNTQQRYNAKRTVVDKDSEARQRRQDAMDEYDKENKEDRWDAHG